MSNYQPNRPGPQQPGRYLREEDRKHRHARKKRIQRRRRLMFGGSITALAVLILLIVLLMRGCTDSGALVGTWTYDGNTTYQFDDDGSGAMKLTAISYDFIYTIDGDQLHIDFENESVHDGTYTFTVDGNTLTLVGGEGTIGGTYTLTKQELAHGE